MSRVFRRSRGLFSACAAVLLGACSQIQLTHQVAEHNRALELSGNEVILLNVVRASKGYPFYFTYLGDLQGKDAASGTLGGTLAFGNHQILKHTGSPSLQLNNGIGQFNVGNPNAEDFALSLVQPLTAPNVAMFLNSDWSTEHFSMLVVRRIGLGKTDYDSLRENFEARCSQEHNDNARLCEAVKSDTSRCRPPESESVNLAKYGQTVPLAKPEQIWVFDNNPEDECQLILFQTAVRLLVLARPIMIQKSDDEPDKTKQGQQKQTKAGTSGRDQAPAADGSKGNVKSSPAELTITHVVSQQGQQGQGQQKETKSRLYLRVEIMRRSGRIDLYDLPVGDSVGGPVGGSGAKVGKTFFMLRSPADIITYLGRLTRLQLTNGRHRPIRVVVDKRDLVSIFEISTTGIDGGAISVTHEGERFVVPRNSYDPRERHMSLQSLMLVNQLLAMRLKRDNLKNATTLFVGQ